MSRRKSNLGKKTRSARRAFQHRKSQDAALKAQNDRNVQSVNTLIKSLADNDDDDQVMSSNRRSARRSTVASSLAAGVTMTPVGGDADATAAGQSPTTVADSQQASSGARLNTECSLFMECEDEPLTPAQNSFRQRQLKDLKDAMAKLEALAAKNPTIQTGENSAVIRTVTETNSNPAAVGAAQTAGPGPTTVTGPGAPIQLGSGVSLTPAGTNIQQGIRLLMDPRTGRILGTINQQGQPAGPAPIRGPIPTNVRAMMNPAGARSPVQLSPATIQQPVAARPSPKVARPAVVDLTRDSKPSTPGAKKNDFPCLSVQPRYSKAGQVPNAQAKRSELDGKVKSLLVHTAVKFTEWLIQQKLVPAEQRGDGTSKMKLGMYSDAKRFPNSGGYVWISETNSNKFVSVYRGSLFEASTHTPTVILKLIYHWCCQTNINNVIQWVKVDNHSVNFYWQIFRSICVATVQEEIVSLGGPGSVVEIGVISLGTTTSDGNKREVRVEVLGVMDRRSGKVRLRATEPVPGASQAARFTKIFEPIPVWIDRGSRIITDFSIDKERLARLGYNNIVQCGIANKRADQTNSQVMDFLKRVVPKMFQNNLSLLTTNEIQQFLDELTFRETFGHFPLMCFESMIKRIATQTAASQSDPGKALPARLKRIANDAFADWRINKSVR